MIFISIAQIISLPAYLPCFNLVKFLLLLIRGSIHPFSRAVFIQKINPEKDNSTWIHDRTCIIHIGILPILPLFYPTVKYKGSWAMCLQSIEHASHATVWETCDVYDKIACCKHIQWMLCINYASVDGHAEPVN